MIKKHSIYLKENTKRNKKIKADGKVENTLQNATLKPKLINNYEMQMVKHYDD